MDIKMPTKLYFFVSPYKKRLYHRRQDARQKLFSSFGGNPKVYVVDLEVGPDWVDITEEIRNG